jgi:hypothetical protein
VCREKEIEDFIKKINELEKEYNVKIVSDHPDAEIMYLDIPKNTLYHIVNKKIRKW